MAGCGSSSEPTRAAIDYYWFGLAPTVETPGHVTDLEVVADGYVAVTPLYLDLTHEPGLDLLGDRFGG